MTTKPERKAPAPKPTPKPAPEEVGELRDFGPFQFYFKG